MRKIIILSLGIFMAAHLGSMTAFAASPRTYHMTGSVLEITDGTIVVEKSKDRWEFARDGSCKITGDLKVGATVTVEYHMTAVSVEVKPSEKVKKQGLN